MLADEKVTAWIVGDEDGPLAFVQDYRVDDWRPHHFDYLPIGARGMDMFIGRMNGLGLGKGAGIARQHAERLLSDGAPAVGIDPHPDNYRAQRAFARAGFSLVGGPLETRWGRALLMHRFAAPRPQSGG